MVKSHRMFPTYLVMAGLAARSELSGVLIILFMAREAVGLEFLYARRLHVAGDTQCLHMRTSQREDCLAVIKGRLFPTNSGVALSAFGPVATFVNIVLSMAGNTLRRQFDATCR